VDRTALCTKANCIITHCNQGIEFFVVHTVSILHRYLGLDERREIERTEHERYVGLGVFGLDPELATEEEAKLATAAAIDAALPAPTAPPAPPFPLRFSTLPQVHHLQMYIYDVYLHHFFAFIIIYNCKH